MIEPRGTIRGAYQALCRARGLPRPDGRPLYEYRLSRSEYDEIRGLLRAAGRSGLNDPHNAALFVAFTAEWYRREREGGHWDWIKPLSALGLRYRQGDPRSDISYADIKAAAETGLRWWGRRSPRHWPLLHGIIAEGGFPAAALRESPNFASWLKRSVLAIDAGLQADEAVGSESWRAPPTLVPVVFEAAVKLCEKVAELRALLPQADQLGDVDPVARLNVLRPDWRKELPFEVEEQDLRLLVEDLVRTRRGDEASGLSVIRRVRKTEASWSAWAELLLSGEISHSKLPHELRTELALASRVRVAPSGALAEKARPLASLERIREEDDDHWDVRPLVSGFDVPLLLAEEMRLVTIAGDKTVAQFTAFSGEPLIGPVIALLPASLGEPEEMVEFEVLGASPAKTARPWMALGVEQALFGAMVFENTPVALGDCGTRRLVAFRGRAELDLDGTRFVWRTGAERDDTRRLMIVGDTVRGAKEQLFRGLPQAFLIDGETSRHVRPRDLLWRSIGQRDWRSTNERPPSGKVEFAVREGGELVAWTRTQVVGPGFRLVANRHARTLRVEGLEGASFATMGNPPPPWKLAGDAAVVDLAGHRSGQPVRMTLTWANTIDLAIDDPIAEPMLLDPQDCAVAPHAQLSLGRLPGYRLLAPERHVLSFEIRSPDGTLVHTSRTIDGVAPLPAYGELLRELLGAQGDLDAHVRMCWLGRGDWIAEVGWYDLNVPVYLPETDSPFDALSAGLGGYSLTAFSLVGPGSGVTTDQPLTRLDEIRARLDERLGDGPWLVLGRAPGEKRLRPKVIAPAKPTETASPLVLAMLEPTRERRDLALDRALADPAALSYEDARCLVRLCVNARQAQAPSTSVDALRALFRHPAAAVEVVAACDGMDERSSVLGLQNDLPLLWCTTSIGDWRAAFAREQARSRTLLASKDLPREFADIQVSAALAQIADQQPILRMHALTTLVDLVPLATVDPTLLRRLGGSGGASAEQIASELLAQRAYGGEPPSNLSLAAAAPNAAPIVQRFDSGFADVLAAPFVAARMAAGRTPYDPAQVRGCRTAWLYDRDYFETGFILALQGEARESEGAIS